MFLFKTMDEVGRIAPDVDHPEWELQIPCPQNSATHLLFNGFCAYLDRRKRHFSAEVITPEPGVLWGRFAGIPGPVLLTQRPVRQEKGCQWLDADAVPALLAEREDHFCLVTKTHVFADAVHIAEKYLAQDFEATLDQEFARRSGTARLFAEMSHHDSLAVICAESLMRSLRPPEGAIPLRWCQSPHGTTAQMDANELPALALAWRLIDIEVAEELLLCAARIQTNSGAIPVLFSPHATHSVLESPKPFFAKTVELVWEVRKESGFLDAILPPLRRHIQWMLHHFDSKRRGLHCWKNRSEMLVPDLYESDLATVDLSVLLLTEIDALNRLWKESALHASQPPCFEEERQAIERNLKEVFWNDAKSAFSNALLRDKPVTVEGFPTFVPLLWRNLENLPKSAILEGIRESGALPGGSSVLSWHTSALDDKAFPILRQLLVLLAMLVADPHGSLLSDYARTTLQAFVEWHTLSLEQNRSLEINPVLAAYIMNVQEIRQYRYHAKGGVSGMAFKLLRKAKADRFDLTVVAVTLFILFSVHLIYDALHTPPPFNMLEAQMNSAYVNRDAVETLKNGFAIIKHYPERAAMAKLLAGNISLLQDSPAEALELFLSVRADAPDSPGPMISLGLACQLEGRFAEAEKNYAEFCYLFDEVFPELVAEITQYRFLAQEGFRTPPKWQEIYRYQLMHEL